MFKYYFTVTLYRVYITKVSPCMSEYIEFLVEKVTDTLYLYFQQPFLSAVGYVFDCIFFVIMLLSISYHTLIYLPLVPYL